MKIKVLFGVAAAALAASLLGACAPGPTSGSTLTPKGTVVASPEQWQQKWEKILADGKKEGVVNVYSSWKPETRSALTQAFKEKYGINLEFSAFGGTSEIIPKVVAENRAGVYSADVFGTGVVILAARQDNILGPLEPLLVTPDVRNPSVWLGGSLPFIDKDGIAFAMVGAVARNLAYNSSIVKEGEIASYKDLLKPQYKSKIVMHDPSIFGAGLAIVAHLGNNVWGEADTTNFLTRLIRDQAAVISRVYRSNIESLAQGKYAVNIGPDSALLPQFIAAGAPVRAAFAEEDTLLVTASGGLTVPPKFAHPNATIVFVNWMLGKEGQSIFARTSGNPSKRLDGVNEGVNAMFIPAAGKKYYNDDSENMELKRNWIEISKKVISEASK